MNKKIIDALSNYDFQYEKNYGYGHIEGYEVNIINNPGQYGPLFYFSTYLPQTKRNDFVVKFNNLKLSLCQASYNDFGVIVMIGALTANGFPKKFHEVLPKILDILAELEAPKSDICPQSGEPLYEDNSKTITIEPGQIKYKLTLSAAEAVKSLVNKDDEDFAAAPNNYLKGFLGILIGAVAGAAITVIFEFLGFITWIAPFVAIFLGTFLYKKFGGKPTFVMIIMSFLTTLLVILGSLFVTYLIVCTNACAENGFTETGISALLLTIEYVDGFLGSFIGDFAINTIIIIVIELFSLSSLLKQIKKVKVKD
ncbi:MAG: hypothetical protein MJZ37_01365 [Bacilli bacterium]|nr:hypothetical protein [Bacilli bacterium]